MGVSAFKGIGRGIGAALKRIFNLRTALVGLVSGAVFGTLTRSIAEQGKELDIWSQKLGTSVEDLSLLQAAAESNGFELETLVEGLKTVQERMDDAAQGAETYAGQFRKLGVEVVDSEGRLRNVVDILPEISAGFQRVLREGGPQELVLITEDLIGGSENLLSVWLQKGPEAFQASIDRARELHLLIDDDFPRATGRFLRSWNELTQSIRQLFRQAFTAIEPFLTTALNFLRRQVTKLLAGIEESGGPGAFFDRLLQRVASAVLVAASFVVSGLATILGAIETLVSRIRDLLFSIVDAFLAVSTVVVSLLGDITGLVQQGLEFAGFVDQSTGTLDSSFENFHSSITTAKAAVSSLKGGVVDLGSTDLDDLAGFFDRIKAAIDGGAIQNFRAAFNQANSEAGGGSGESEEGSTEGGGPGFFGKFFAGAKEGIQRLRRDFNDIQTQGVQAFQRIGSAIENGLTNAIVDVINGTKSLGDAFAELGKLILLELQRVIVRLIVVQTLTALLSLIPGTDPATTSTGLSALNANAGDPAGGLGGAQAARAVAFAGSGPGFRGPTAQNIQVTVQAPIQSTASASEVVDALARSGDQVGQLVAQAIATNSNARAAARAAAG